MKTSIISGKVCVIVILTLFSISLYAQNVGINTTGATPAATNMLEVLQPSTTASSIGIYSLHSGAITGTGYGLWSQKTGASTTNVGGYFAASGATNNYGLIVNGGNVGFGTTTPSAAAILDMSSVSTQGLLIPNVSLLTGTTTQTLTNVATGLLVYNTNTVGSGSTALYKGFYYWTGSAWVPFLDGTPPNAGWMLTGNYNATASTSAIGVAANNNYLGTNNASDLVFTANTYERMRIATATGFIGINQQTPAAQLEIVSASGTHGLYVHTPNTGCYLGYETPFTACGSAASGAGLYATNPLANYMPLYTQTTGAANFAAFVSYSNVWIPVYGYCDNSSSTYDPEAIYGQLNPTSTTAAFFESAIVGYQNRAATADNPGYSIGVLGQANSANQDAFAVEGDAFCNAAYSVGGYFDGNNYTGTNLAYAYVGGNVNGTDRKIAGSGTSSEIIPTPTHGRIMLTCPESPEYWYQDYGTVKLVNGKAHVDLDPILADIIFVNDSNPIRVFCTPVNMLEYNGVAVINQTDKGFDLVEVNGGTHSGSLYYQIVAKPRTNYGEGRFFQAPGPLGSPKDNHGLAHAKNQINPSKIWHWQSDELVYGYKRDKPQPKGVKKPENIGEK